MKIAPSPLSGGRRIKALSQKEQEVSRVVGESRGVTSGSDKEERSVIGPRVDSFNLIIFNPRARIHPGSRVHILQKAPLLTLNLYRTVDQTSTKEPGNPRLIQELKSIAVDWSFSITMKNQQRNTLIIITIMII